MLEILEGIKGSSENKSLVTTFMKLDERALRQDPNYKFLVNFKMFMQRVTRHHGRRLVIDERQQKKLEELLCAG